MRFIADGPNIPDELLEERDNGNVVFFCGAGISLPAGLPGFRDLCEQVMRKLGTSEDAKSRALFRRADDDPTVGPPFDQVFSHLQDEYGAATIDEIVSGLLKTPQNANTSPHALILRLSRSAARNSQVITTNFDLLFERADRSLHKHVPPALPDLASEQPLKGLVYLHGRMRARSSDGVTRQGLILSSADFGRAYLAEGWATRFVRDLLRRYVIVLEGYSATDPPVRYLLEGLHARNDKDSARIYAFDSGTDEEVRERWRNRGVTAIPYRNTDRQHSALWNTLEAWAERADDPKAWRLSLVEMARRGPRALAPHERGQVVALTSTVAGAKFFADADPALPAEWLCVFDKTIRRAEPSSSPMTEDKFDPLEYFGLDDDPPRSSIEEDWKDPHLHDVLSMLPEDERTDGSRRLAGPKAIWLDPIPARHFHIARWIGKLVDDPLLAWWVAGYRDIHPRLLNFVEWQIERGDDREAGLRDRTWWL